MKKIALISLFALTLTGCHFGHFNMGHGIKGSGVRKTETRTLPAFHSVSLSGAFDAEIVCQQEQSLTIEGDDNILPLVTTEVRDGELRVGSDGAYSVNKSVHLKITMPSVDAVQTSGASKIVVTNVRGDNLKVKSSGASTVIASGETASLDINMSGAGKIDARELHAGRVGVDSSGAGHAEVFATEELNATVSGAASVSYYGDPKVLNQKVSGVGSIKRVSAAAS